MPGWWEEFVSNPRIVELCAAGLAVLPAAGFLLRKIFRKRPTEAELERARRDEINRKGKLGDGEVIDVEGIAIIYSYQVAGVGYTASQDVSALETLMPGDTMSVLGPAGIKFDPRNPANSIVLCETWSGLRDRETISRSDSISR